MYTFLFVFVAFILGLYMCLNYKSNDFKEGLENNHKGGKKRCPDVLIQKGSKYHLLNTSLGKVPGVNPVVFDNLEDYVEFLNWQKSQNIICPILFLQRSYNAQGKEEYKIRPSPFDKQGGLGSDPQGGLPKKHHLKMPDGNTTVIIQGKRRFEIQSITKEEPYLKASIIFFFQLVKKFHT